MTTILERIVATKQEEVMELFRLCSIEGLRRDAEQTEPPRDFARAVTDPSEHGIQLIAELKKASPSAGVIVSNFDPVAIARAYYLAGAAALSVLTDRVYFQGRLEFIREVKEAVPLPVLRKDFILDERRGTIVD